ncbi:hypothetical protein D9758_008713 [Tetrapyrgos nigripes]|uniref:CENP-V/GFA domain-containing protein n=1 Tax=Tetrapyrgos nigripes TaxID=182062 RepID=A0A8H5D447_9AGAR|nr:hypothetical protein D9758_008713 [Tetrapyrgos nigripes]
MSDSRKIRKGSCLCGQNTFLVTGNPSLYVICHCVNCQKATGTAFMSNGMFKEEDVDFTGCKQITIYNDSATRSGRTSPRRFCTVCGSKLYIHENADHMKDIVIIPMALIDDFQDWAPHEEVFEETKCPFVKEIVTKPADA